MELTLKDFQGWKEAELTVEGFTVVTGSSNRGKSALTRALKAVLRNGITEGNVRLGSKEARVGLTLDDHGLIEASRTRKGSASYVVNGEEFAALGGKIPPVMADWGYQPVEVSGVKIDPIFAGQFDPQFLLSSSPAETSAILNAFSSTERLDRGKKVLKGKVSEVDSEAKLLGAQVSTLEVQVAQLTTQSAQAELLRQQINDRATVARRAQLQVIALDRLVKALQEDERVQEHLTAIDRAGIQIARTLCSLAQLLGVAKLHMVLNQQAEVAAKLTGLEGLDAKLDVALKAYLRLERLARIHGVGLLIAHGQIERDTLSRVQEPLERALHCYKVLVRCRALLLADTAPIRAQIERIRAVDLGPAQLRLHQAGLALTAAQAALASATVQTELSSIQQDLIRNEVEQRHAQADLDQWIDVNQIIECPKCHYEFTRSENHDEHR
jgi:hypothetical protein